jgi:hypothetical protein
MRPQAKLTICGILALKYLCLAVINSYALDKIFIINLIKLYKKGLTNRLKLDSFSMIIPTLRLGWGCGCQMGAHHN